ncbi:hypothetical protein SAMN04487775_103130 [Treponema bryantii]|uniref:Pesticidal crystal protein Cry22Aa Ig-like domain-containing protein n=1 Tax=Treponema bryantii TaxID=163 RepID=A0A1I3JMP6_9SPIR|nr:immunoglobulin-like domain-containing protein [Treponema bryantii]SFI61537.1 hypothetical protein SAMN04487775_103130 [Treponema bryantii]
MKKEIKGLCASLMITGAALSLAACKKTNTAPVINGAKDNVVKAGIEFDAMEGITASDKEDGNLTSKIMIESTPKLSFKNGKTTAENAGSYELVYSVTDSDGNTVEAYSTLTVGKKTGDAVVYKAFDFGKALKVDSQGWNAKISDAAGAQASLSKGAYVFDINNPGNGDGDIQLVKSGIELKAADYRVRIWAKSTKDTYAHILARNEKAAGWETFGGAFNVRIGKEVSPLELNFTGVKNGKAELLFNLGKITPNPENAKDTTPENFTVTIDKIEFYEISGEETKKPLFTNDFSSSKADSISVSAGDGADAKASVENKAGRFAIAKYPADGGVWSIKADTILAKTKIENGKKYYYSLKAKSEKAQSGECLVESASKYDACRVNFAGLNLKANEETIVSGVFTADKDVEDPVIRFQIGNPSDGVSANTITIDDVEFGLLEGDKEITKTIYAFNPYKRSAAGEKNSDNAWETFNGTDEDNDRGVGTIWNENGSLFYRIDQGGITDWHNKLIYGYGQSPLVLESDSYYTVEIKAKADKNVSCGFFLNPLGSWDPRIAERIDFTPQEQTFTFTTKDTFVTDMNFEMLFQFGSEQTANLGEVTVEITDMKIYQMKTM